MQMLIKVRVKTGVKNDSIRKIGDRYNIAVREKPEQNAANLKVLALLAAELGIPTKKLRITKGQHSPSKTITML